MDIEEEGGEIFVNGFGIKSVDGRTDDKILQSRTILDWLEDEIGFMEDVDECCEMIRAKYREGKI